MTAARDTVLGVAQTPPTFDVPRNACDCHVHVFAPPDQFPFSAGRVYTPGVASVDDLRSLQRVLYLDRVVITQASPYGVDNSCLLDALRRLHPRARGVAGVSSATAEAALEAMQEAGVRGVRVNLESHGQRDPAAARDLMLGAASRVAAMGWHVQIYATLSVIAALHDTILSLPTRVVVDHFGLAQAASGPAQPGFDTLLSLLRGGRIYVKLSAAYRISTQDDYDDAAVMARALIDANPDRILWGTDWPHPGGISGEKRDPGRIEPFRPEDDGRALNRLRRWVPDPAQLRKILVENPAQLYGF
ncbi:MAG TPA: amidohydrolase family protein [bacterium]|nr:amidohydrolase family protein [bacterium]